MSNYSVKTADINEIGEIYKSFLEAYFPEDELKPLESIMRMYREGLYTIIELLDYDEVVAVACMTELKNTNKYLLDYFAVHSEYRSMGVGSAMLKKCTEIFPDTLIYIESEAVEMAANEEQRTERDRRYKFYERNGCRLTGVQTDIFGVIYDNWILSNLPEEPKENVETDLKSFYKYMIPVKKLYDDNVFIPRVK